MFVGHLAVALGAKTVEPRPPLAAYVAAAFGLDLLWPLFLLAGIETVRIAPGATAFTPLDFVSYPWSHSLLMAVVWAGLAALVTANILRAGRAAVAVGLVVLSHWMLDWITHAPDLPLWPGGPKSGAGLWNSIPATITVEGLLFAGAIWFYSRSAPARDKTGRWALVVAAGTNGGYHVAKAYFDHGISTVIYLHVDYGDLTKMREEKLKGNNLKWFGQV